VTIPFTENFKQMIVKIKGKVWMKEEAEEMMMMMMMMMMNRKYRIKFRD
jgi:predicted component of type VI protein secretion system